MGFLKGAGKYLPGGDKSPGGAIHRGINKAVGIEEGFMQPNPMRQRVEANRTGDSQWQKFNPTNIRDFNERMGYNFQEGGRDPKDEITGTPPPPGAPVAGTAGTTAGAQPPISTQAPNPVSKMQKQFAQSSQMRGGPIKRPRELGGR